MTIIPAIDLLDGQVVRLTKGDYKKKNVYNDDPLDEARKFSEAGFNHIHVVDLNGAKTGIFENTPHLSDMIAKLHISIQTGGGIRTLADIERLLNAGISKVICSSMAVKNPDEWMIALEKYADHCILGMDLKNGKMAYGGWLKTSDLGIEDFLKPMIKAGLQEVLCTDISRDGTLEGPNFELYRNLTEQFQDLRWIASGGVSSTEDLNTLDDIGLYGVVVGKAYYEGKISLKQLAG